MNQYRPLGEYADLLQQRLLRLQCMLWCQQHQAIHLPATSRLKLGQQEFYPAELSAATMLQLSELQLILPCYQLRKGQQNLLHVARPGWWQRLWHRPKYWQLCIRVTRSSIELTLAAAPRPAWRRGHYYFSLQLDPEQADALHQAATPR